MRLPSFLISLIALLVTTVPSRADTAITFTRAEVDQMANLWETDSLAITPLADAQYPAYTTSWQFIFPHTSISTDGDIHADMAVDAAGTGKTGNNTGASPIVTEVINAASADLSALGARNAHQEIFRGIFRFYTEHASERHFELHPVTQLLAWNGVSFVLDLDYHGNINSDANGTTHSGSTLTGVLDGSQTIHATIGADNSAVAFTFPSPSVNYVQYDGTALSAVQSDTLSEYFLFRPDLVPNVTVRCRIVSNTTAAATLASLAANQTLTVNALTRTDMATVSAQIAPLTAGQAKTFPRPIELITLGVSNLSPPPTPTPAPTATPSATPITNSFTNAAPVTISGANSGRGSPYPASIAVSGVVGKITKTTARLNAISEAKSSDFASDLDIMMVGPLGQKVMLMSDAGGSQKLNSVTLTFDDGAAGLLPQSSAIVTGTYKPTNYPGDSDAFPSPAPSGTPGTLLSVYNNTNPNGAWNLFVLDEYFSGGGSIANGWTVTFEAQPAAPDAVSTAATVVKSSSAILNGTYNSLGQATTYQFQFGTDTNYTFTQLAQNGGSGTSVTPASLTLAGLRPTTTYHFRLIATNATGTTYGSDLTFTTAAATDSDGDGMPNDYEIDNGFDPNNSADGPLDTDGDGLTNVQEYRAGTNPRSASSFLRITAAERGGEDYVLTFPSVFGKLYRVEFADSPGGPWSTLQDNVVGTGAPIPVNDTEAFDLHPQRFYHVTVLP